MITRKELIALIILTIFFVIHLILTWVGMRYWNWLEPNCVPRWLTPMSIITWVIVYAISFGGYLLYVKYSKKKQKETETKILFLVILSMILVCVWDVTFYFFRLVRTSIFLYIFILMINLYLIICLWQIDKVVALLQLPIFIRMIFMFAQECRMLNCHCNCE